jgi:DNA-binding FadR family transcriptional regulator
MSRNAAYLEENLSDLQAIAEAVAAGDAKSAYRLARDHVRRFQRHMKPTAGPALSSGEKCEEVTPHDPHPTR